MAAALPLVVIMEKGAEAAEALNVTEIFYNRVADHIRNQPDAAPPPPLRPGQVADDNRCRVGRHLLPDRPAVAPSMRPRP